ncbi:MAG: type II toxin-antitoxin system VapC family toxin [Deltaproteobacteria bacterium]|nr:type II toxin-antitoxin system VapC family toxin [Deltaproteobacteria bacterium]
MYLLDTDTVIFSLKGHPVLMENLRRHLNDPLQISIVTCLELYYGAYKSKRITGNLAKVKKIEETFEVIPVGTETAEIFGRLKAQLETKGTRLDDFDLLIAACALTHNLILVTNNEAHFHRIEGLKLTNWLKPAS